MTDHYLDIRLLPDPEFTASVLMSALFSKLHRALVAQDTQGIGISFPEMRQQVPTLGKRLRLHGEAGELDRLMTHDWLKGMRDHTSVSDILPVPQVVEHRTVRRVQAKSSPDRLRRRFIKRHDATEQEARDAIPGEAAERLDLPFVVIRSQSTGQLFRLFVEHLPVQPTPVAGEFGSYGLSQGATVPWF